MGAKKRIGKYILHETFETKISELMADGATCMEKYQQSLVDLERLIVSSALLMEAFRELGGEGKWVT